MKIIVSHDVDHLTAWEHRKDLIIPKYAVRTLIETTRGYASLKDLASRFGRILSNRLHNIEELMEFDGENDVRSTFFIAVSNGRNLNYPRRDTECWIHAIVEKGFGVGVHGVAFNNYSDIKREKEDFGRLSKKDNFGIRVHNIGRQVHSVRLSTLDIHLLSKAGYAFSSNVFGIENPFKAGNLWEFPIQIMDGHVFQKKGLWQDQSLEQAKIQTQKSVNDACARGMEYFNILFHDFYFSKSFKVWRDWYCWFIDYCKKNGFPLVDYERAVQELEQERQTDLSAE